MNVPFSFFLSVFDLQLYFQFYSFWFTIIRHQFSVFDLQLYVISYTVYTPILVISFQFLICNYTSSVATQASTSIHRSASVSVFDLQLYVIMHNSGFYVSFQFFSFWFAIIRHEKQHRILSIGGGALTGRPHVLGVNRRRRSNTFSFSFQFLICNYTFSFSFSVFDLQLSNLKNCPSPSVPYWVLHINLYYAPRATPQNTKDIAI